MTIYESLRHHVERHEDIVVKTFQNPTLYEKEKTCYEGMGVLLESNDEKLSLSIPYMGEPVSSITHNMEGIISKLKSVYSLLPHEDKVSFDTLNTVFDSTWKKIALFPVEERAASIMSRVSAYLDDMSDTASASVRVFV